MSASSRIERYLKDHPDGDLLIAVGYATAPGIAWLARRTAGRRVALLIGDTRSQWWKKMSEPDRAACLAFIRRDDVEIRNWYRTNRSRSGESAAHLKVWAVHDTRSPASVLVGSGNLTRKGLEDNVEVMVEAHGSDMRQTWDTLQVLWGKAWPCADRLTGYLAGPKPPAAPRHHQRGTGNADHPDTPPEPTTPPRRPRVHTTQTASVADGLVVPPTRAVAHNTPPLAAPLGSDMAAAEPQKPPPRTLADPPAEATPSAPNYAVPGIDRVEGAAVAGFLLAIVGAGAPIIDIHRHGPWDSVFSWHFLAEALCLGIALGLSWWARERSEGVFKGLANAGGAISVLALAAMPILLLVLVVIWALPVLRILAALLVLVLLMVVLANARGPVRRRRR